MGGLRSVGDRGSVLLGLGFVLEVRRRALDPITWISLRLDLLGSVAVLGDGSVGRDLGLGSEVWDAGLGSDEFAPPLSLATLLTPFGSILLLDLGVGLG